MKKFISLALLLLVGCATRTYTSTATDGSVMEVKSSVFLVWGQLAGFQATKSGVTVTTHASGTEAEKLGPIITAISEGVARGMAAQAAPGAMRYQLVPVDPVPPF